MKTYRWLLLLFILAFAAPLSAQDVDVNTLTEQFDAFLPALLEEHGVVGASLALIHDGEVVWSGGYGVTDSADGVPVTADTIFSVESISKAVTAWEIMRLVEAGQIDLDAPINQYLTDWQVPTVGRTSPDEVTVRRILSHTAGLSVEGYRGYDTETDALPSLIDVLNGDASGLDPVRVFITPGRQFLYSGGGYTALQLMIENVTGESFGDVMRRDVFHPLGMEHTYSNWTEDSPYEWATSYTAQGDVDNTLLHVDLAAGGMFTSAADLARFFTDGLNGDWLAPESVALMHSPAEATKDQYGFGNFLLTLDDGTQVVWHDGIGIGQRSIFFLLPESGDGLIILTNTARGNAIFREIVCAWDAWLHDGEATRLCGNW